MYHCPRCDQEVIIVKPGAVFYCKLNPQLQQCFVMEHYYKLAMEGKMETRDLLNERQKTHGDYNVHAAITQQLKDAMFDQDGWTRLDTCQREALHMIAHKIGRILAGNPSFKDHWDDIAGYAKLVADRCPT